MVRIKKTAALCLSVFTILSIFSNTFFYRANAYVENGYWKKTSIQYFLKQNGTLILSGTGSMGNEGLIDALVDGGPYQISDKVTNIVVNRGITSLGTCCFYCYYGLKQASLPNGLETIERWSFYRCGNLEAIVIPKSVKTIGSAAFWGCDSLTDVYYSGSSDDWKKISIGSDNSLLSKANFHFNSNYDFSDFINLEDLAIAIEYKSASFVDEAQFNFENGYTSILADGYYTAEFNDINPTNAMIYAVVPKSTGSHISAVHCNGVDALVDAQYVEFPIAGDSEEDKNREVNIQVYTDLTDHKGFQLLYDGTVLSTSEDGIFSLKAKDITAGHTLKVRVIDADGKKLPKIDTNIKTYKTTFTGKFEDNKFSITFPQDLKIIGGWKFDVDFSSLPFFVVKDEDTMKIGVGYNKKSEWSKLEGWNDKTSNWDKEGTADALWKDLKKSIDKIQESILENTAGTIMGEKLASFSDFKCSCVGEFSPVKIDAKAAFYLELQYKDGVWTQVGANGFISISCKFGATATVIAFYVPLNFSIECELGAKAEATILYDTENAKFDYSGSIELTVPKLTGSVTIGIPKVFDGGGFVRLTNKLNVTMWNNIKGTLTGDFGVKGTFVVFHGEKTLWSFLNWEYLNKDFGDSSDSEGGFRSSSKQSVKQRTLDLSDIGNTDDVFEESAYSLDMRDYLENQSEWLGTDASNRGVKKAPSLTKTTLPTLLQSSIYQEANPQIISTDDGTMLMVWTADIAERTTGNQTAVVYSVYDETTGSWSVPAIVSDDGTADAYPDIATDGENIYVTWVNTNTTFDESMTMEEFAAACEISTAKYDSKIGEFVNVQTITNNGSFDFMPAVYADNGEVYIAYTENSDNSPLAMSGTNTVTLVRLAGDSFETVVQTVFDKPVESLDISKIAGNLYAAIAVDNDGDMQTTEDVEIFIVDGTGMLSQYTNNELYERSVQFESINGESALAYFDDSGIHYAYDFADETIIDSESGLNVSSDFYFVDDEDGTILLTRTNMSDSDITNVYASVWDGETWVGNTQITDCSDDLKSFSACKNANGDIQLVYTTAQYETEITEDNGDGSATGTYSETVDMYATIHKKTTDVELVAVDFEDDDVVLGENLPVSVYVKNNGLKSIDTITVLGSCLEEEDSKDIPINLKPGQMVEIEYSFPVPTSLNGLSDVNFTVSCDGDINPDNNTQAVQIGYADLSLNLKKLSSGGLTSAVITITNNSCFATDAKVLLHKDSYANNVMSEYLVSGIPSFGKKIFYLSADAINKNFEYEDAVCVEILSSNPEKATGDNYDFFTVNTPEIEEWSYTTLENNKIRIDKYNGTDTNLVIPDTYDDYIVGSLDANVIPSCVTSITLPSGLETVTSTAFNSATGLTEINVNENNPAFTSKNGILYSADGTKVIRCPIAIENKTLVLPDDVIEINNYAFANVSLTSVVLPESLQIIRSYAFSNNNITTLTIPESVTRIERNSFEKCSNLAEINYNAVNAETGISATGFLAQYLIRQKSVFYNDSNIQKIEISSSVQSLPTGLFVGLSGLQTVNIALESDLASIEQYTFLSDSALSDIYYGRYYKYWKQITIADGNTPITNATLHCVECEECTWNDGVITTAATCIATGEKLFTCTVCEKERKEIIAIDPNNHAGDTNLINKKDPTCTQEGYTGDTVCSDCKVVLESGTSIPKKDHTWDSGTVTQPASCTESGIKTFNCTNCTATRTETIDALGHDVSTEWTIDNEPTCTEDGSKSHHCSRCDFTTDITVIDALGHSWDKGEITTPATCTETGIRTFTCSACQETRTEIVDEIGHDFGNWTGVDENQHQRICRNDSSHVEKENHSWNDGVVTQAAFCTEDGIRTYTCSVCGATKTSTINTLGHKYGSWTKLDENQHQRICENNSSHIEKENHSWNDGTVTKAATCTETGIRTFTCTVCGAKKTESIKATGHNYGAWTIVKAPTCTAEGVEQRVCSNDNKHVETRPIAKSAHVDNDGDGYCDNCHTDLGSGGETQESNCVCGKYHTGPFAGIIKFFHKIVYFFKNMFNKN